jgi:hypothetical protein
MPAGAEKFTFLITEKRGVIFNVCAKCDSYVVADILLFIHKVSGGTQMFHDFDIFQTVADNTLWIGTAGTLREAKSQIQKSVIASSGLFLVLDQRTGDKVTFRPEDFRETRPPAA